MAQQTNFMKEYMKSNPYYFKNQLISMCPVGMIVIPGEESSEEENNMFTVQAVEGGSFVTINGMRNPESYPMVYHFSNDPFEDTMQIESGLLIKHMTDLIQAVKLIKIIHDTVRRYRPAPLPYLLMRFLLSNGLPNKMIKIGIKPLLLPVNPRDRMAMNLEETLVILKPDSDRKLESISANQREADVHQNLRNLIIYQIIETGCEITRASGRVNATRESIEKHYEEHKEKHFFDGLIEYMLTEGDLRILKVTGVKAVKKMRDLLGKDFMDKDNTIRGMYAIDFTRNTMHASDSVEAAQKELKIWNWAFESK
jgi:nucleoside-diphosphate kinase